jgi:FAD/FMN-containing dehydrogenase
VLRPGFRGQILLPDALTFEELRHVWNHMIDRSPAAIARCTGVADVIEAVRVARERNLLVSVRGGGHNVAGTAVADGARMIDLSGMKGIRVDPSSRRAVAQPGVLWGEFDRETAVHDLATTGGLVSTTGIAGFTLGGGLGWLMRQHGLACDNLRSADIVTADGCCLTASADENPDLFWGLRGGGGNFGVVTSFEYDLYPLANVLAGPILHPWSAAGDLLRYFREIVAAAPDELTVHAGLIGSEEGERYAAFMVCYAGDLADGERVVGPIRAWGTPVVDGVDVRPYTEWQSMFDEANAHGRRNYWKSNMLRTLDDDAIDTMLDAYQRVPSWRTNILIEGLGGAVARVGEDATAYTHRDAAFDLLLSSVWEDPAEDEANVEWTRDTFASLAPSMRDSVYVNYLGNEGAERVREAYGPAKYERLVELKDRYDPANLFRLNQNIPPSRLAGHNVSA